jgi:hypothetical protein
MSEPVFDVVIPLGPDDRDIASVTVAAVRRFVEGAGTIYVVSPADPMLPGTAYVADSEFPFDKAEIARLAGSSRRSTWYLQQLLKLHFGLVRPDARDRYLVVDADVAFLRPCRFVVYDRIAFNTGIEYHPEYFRHMRRLHPQLYRMTAFSGVSHCMLFDRNILRELFELVESHHERLNWRNRISNAVTRRLALPPKQLKALAFWAHPDRKAASTKAKPFWRIFLEQVNGRAQSGASEYELFFHYCLSFHPHRVAIVPMRWDNVSRFQEAVGRDLDYVALHHNGRAPVGTAEFMADWLAVAG